MEAIEYCFISSNGFIDRSKLWRSKMKRTSLILIVMNVSLSVVTSLVHRSPSLRLNSLKRLRLIPRHVQHDVYHNINTPELDSTSEYRTVPKYEFKYSVSDSISGDYKTHHESKSGNQVKGEYSFVESDGFIRRVKYTADDEHGFVAVVSRTPIIASQQPKLHIKSYANPVTSYVSSSNNFIKPELNFEIVKARDYVPEKVEPENSRDDSIPYVLNLSHSKSIDQIYQTDPDVREHKAFAIKDFHNDERNISSTKYEVTEEIVPEDVKLSILQHTILRMGAGDKQRSSDNENPLETSPVTFPTTRSNGDVIVITKAKENETKPIKNISESKEISNSSVV